MGPKALISALERVLPTGQPVFLWGAPGIGKSDCVRAACKRLGRDLIDQRAALLDPVDLRGIPSVKDGRTHWCPPEFLPNDPNSDAVVFLDELPQAAPMVQSALLQLVLDRQLGEYKLPAGVTIIAAGNRAEDRAGGHRMITPIMNRFLHLDVEVSKDDWTEWAAASSGKSDTPNVCVEVRSFIEFRPKVLHDFDASQNPRAFPSPRSWSFVSRILPVASPDNEHALISGCVGDGAAAEFLAYAKIWRAMPDINTIIADPMNAHFREDEPAVIYAVTGALAEKCRKAEQKVWRAVAKFAGRLSQEYGTLLIRSCKAVAGSEFVRTPEAREWISKNSNVILASTSSNVAA